jgi:hypothetical protein
VAGIPYLAMFISMMPTLTTLAGMNSDSEGSRKDFLKEPGWDVKRNVMSVHVRRNWKMFNIRKTFANSLEARKAIWY